MEMYGEQRANWSFVWDGCAALQLRRLPETQLLSKAGEPGAGMSESRGGTGAWLRECPPQRPRADCSSLISLRHAPMPHRQRMGLACER